ncbi:GGDEF domain-containing protein [Angustibacter sp. Root456]|uniref:GGDEF domain-containing protein n=1 Tax=Angustibacter sp. Root456 TaxID=1736539 RepID=UPI0012FB46D9|nr:GGDEF domain-containing protein [Angustibacter sp. Root456]
MRSTSDAARLGRWLMVFQGLTIGLSGWWVSEEDGVPWVVFGAATAMVLVGLISAALPWRRWDRWTTAAYPHAAMVVLVALGVGAPSAAPAYVALLTLWFMYVGVVAPVHTGLRTLPAAVVTFVAMQRHVGPEQVVRLVLAALIWAVLADVLALRAAANLDRANDLQQQAETDALTGLPNRRALETTLATLSPGDVVLVLDLDHFKQVNDSGGHDYGDQVLVDFATTLLAVVRGRDQVARYGGEEFVLVLPQDNGLGLGAASVTARLRQRWAEHYPHITWSGGASCHQAGADPHLTLRDADRALYRAKEAGRDRVLTNGFDDVLHGLQPAHARAL